MRIAALLYFTGLTGPLLRWTLQSRGAWLILCYHGTTDGRPGYFSRGHSITNVLDQLQYLQRHLHPVTLEEIALAVSRGDAPRTASFAVTFDDGLGNNAIHAIPVLRKLQLPAAFFVPSSLVGSSRDLWTCALREIVLRWRGETIPEEPGIWPALPITDEKSRFAAFFRIKQALKGQEGRRQEILDRLAEQAGGYSRPPEADRVASPDLLLRMTQPGFSVGAHSRTHPILSALDSEKARAEIEGSRTDLEKMVGRPVLDFAYPNGRFPDISDTTRSLVAEAGYRCAVTTEPGTVRRGDDPLALRRCLPGDVPAFVASFELLTRVWADWNRPGDLSRPVRPGSPIWPGNRRALPLED